MGALLDIGEEEVVKLMKRTLMDLQEDEVEKLHSFLGARGVLPANAEHRAVT